MIAVRQMHLRPRPRGLDLPSRCGARLMPARLRNKPVLNAPPRTRLELMRSLQRTPRGSCRVPKSRPSGLVVELGGPVIFRHRARFESLAATAKKLDTGRRTAPRRTAASSAASPVTSRPIALLANAARMQTHVHGRLQRVHSLRCRVRLLSRTTRPTYESLGRADLMLDQMWCTSRPVVFHSKEMMVVVLTVASKTLHGCGVERPSLLASCEVLRGTRIRTPGYSCARTASVQVLGGAKFS